MGGRTDGAGSVRESLGDLGEEFVGSEGLLQDLAEADAFARCPSCTAGEGRGGSTWLVARLRSRWPRAWQRPRAIH
jgi:hypothetical protein